MTLIEVLVVIAILGIFMAICVPSVIKSFRVTSQVKNMTARYPDARKALARISDGIRRTYPTALQSGAAFEGKNSSIEIGGIMLPSDSLSFPVLDTAYSHVRSAHKISYSLDLAGTEGEPLRGLVEKRSFFGAVAEAGIEESMPGQIVGLDFRYLDDSLKPAQWVEVWPPSPEEQTDRVPAAVKITIFSLGEVSPEPKSFTTVANIPARARLSSKDGPD
jgi:prepilin-type N-terminal cleavage/methylation domain-containing protein